MSMQASHYPQEGGCACGTIRYRVTSQPLVIHCCHCTWCQRETGAAFALNAMIEAERVELLPPASSASSASSTSSAAPKIVPTPSASGAGQKISRCPVCFVAVWSNYGADGDVLRFVRVGTLDSPAMLGGPDVHIFTGTKVGWVNLEGCGVPVFEEDYDKEDVWRVASLERFKAVEERIGEMRTD